MRSKEGQKTSHAVSPGLCKSKRISWWSTERKAPWETSSLWLTHFLAAGISRSPYRPVWRCLPTAPAAQGSCGKGCRSLLSCPHSLPACWAREKGPFHLEASQERAKLAAAGASSARRFRTDSGFECSFSSGSMQVLVRWSTEVVTCKEVQFFFSLANNEAPTCLSCQVMPNETAAPQVSHPLLGSQDPVHVW